MRQEKFYALIEPKEAWRGVLKIGACTAAKHKVIFIMALQMV